MRLQDGGAKGAEQTLLFRNGFEAEFVPLPTTKVQMTLQAFASALPLGTQIETLSERLFTNNSVRYLQANTELLGRIFPDPRAFQLGSAFASLRFSPGGEVEATLTPVDLSLDNPSASTSGCESTDFAGFPAGHIALIQRGSCPLNIKARNAEKAGAVGVIIFNQGTSGQTGFFTGTLEADYRGTAPVMSTSFQLGRDWATSGPATFRMRAGTGQADNAWQLVPIAGADAHAQEYWVRNAQTGQLLATRPQFPYNGITVSSVQLDSAAPTDQRAWWRIGGTRILNVSTRQTLAITTSLSGATVFLFTTFDLARLCASGDTCGDWNLDERFERAAVGSTRLRSALGDYYLNADGRDPKVSRVKPGWQKARWVLEPVSGTPVRRLRNELTGDYLYVKDGQLQVGQPNAGLAPGETPPPPEAAMWDLEDATRIAEMNTPGSFNTTPLSTPITNASGYQRLRNLQTGQLLVAQDGLALTGSAPTDSLRALWVMDDLPIAPIADTALRTAIAAELGKSPSEPILSSEAAGMVRLSAPNAGISSLSGLEVFKNLVELNLPGNNITDLSPLVGLTELDSLDLSRNPLQSIAPLEANAGIGDGDRVVLLQTRIGRDELGNGALLLARGVTLIPGPGLTLLQVARTSTVVDPSVGALNFLNAELAANGANWNFEYDSIDKEYFLRNNSYANPREGYLTWNRDESRLEISGKPSRPEWLFDLAVLAGEYRIRNTRVSGSFNRLQNCSGALKVGSSDVGCTTVTWQFDRGYVDGLQARVPPAYTPDFSPPGSGFTRIQNFRSKEFLDLNSGALSIARIDEPDAGAQWRLLPIALESTYVFAIQNRQDPARYLRRNADGTIGAGALPGVAPSGATWAADGANQPFLFYLDGDGDAALIRPLLAPELLLRAEGRVLRFASPNPEASWVLDGGIKIPETAAGSAFVELRNSAELTLYKFKISWSEPSNTPGAPAVKKSFSEPGLYTMKETATDIRVTATCVGCGPAFRDRVVLNKLFERPPNRCYESRGTAFNPHYGKCNPEQGELSVFAANAAKQVACEIAALVDYVPSAFDQLGLKKVTKDLIDQRFERAQQTLFSQGDLSGPDFSACSPYRSMSFGAGASVGAFIFEAGGEIGLVWGLSKATAGVLSYTSTGTSVSGSIGRIISIGVSASLGVWKAVPKDTGGESVGLSLVGSYDATVVLKKLQETRKIPINAGITLWFECGSGSGPIVSNRPCVLREDSKYEGFSVEFGTEAAASLPIPEIGLPINLLHQTGCVPANFSGDDC